TVQIENVRVENVHARDQVGFTDNHPDCIQTYGNVRHLEVQNFTCDTDYQGIFMSADYDNPHGSVNLTNVNIRSNDGLGRYFMWVSELAPGAGPYHFENVWAETSQARINTYGSHWNGWKKVTYPESDRTEGIAS